MDIKLDMYQSLVLAMVMYLIGQAILNRSRLLQHFCIPAPVIGGLLFAIVHAALRAAGILRFEFDTTLQNVFMMAFFCSVGFLASFSLLKSDKSRVVKLMGLSIVIIIIQDTLGTVGAKLFGLDTALGLAMGSIPLVGGHGSAGAFGPFLEENGVAGATTVAIAAATYGLVAGSIMGGPIASRKIRKFSLHSSLSEDSTAANPVIHHTDINQSGASYDEQVEMAQHSDDIEWSPDISSTRLIRAAILVIIVVGVGATLTDMVSAYVTLPGYIGAMLIAAITRNVANVAKHPLPLKELDAISHISLALFLSVAMANLKLWELVGLAIPMITILAVQTLVVWAIATFVAFRLLGRDYEAATMTAGLCGFAMGATPNAMANMQAVVRHYGPAPCLESFPPQDLHIVKRYVYIVLRYASGGLTRTEPRGREE